MSTSVLITALRVAVCMAISFASWPVAVYWGSAVIYPVMGPDLILYHPSRLSRISPAALLVILPMILPSDLGSARTFK